MKSVSLATVSTMGIAFKLFENKIKDSIQKFKNVRIFLKQIIIAKNYEPKCVPFYFNFFTKQYLRNMKFT